MSGGRPTGVIVQEARESAAGQYLKQKGYSSFDAGYLVHLATSFLKARQPAAALNRLLKHGIPFGDAYMVIRKITGK